MAGIVLVGTAILGLRAVPALLRWHERTLSSITHKARQVNAITSELALVPQLEDSAAQVRRAFVGIASSMLSATTATEASAELVVLLRTVLADESVTIERVVPAGDTLRYGLLHRTSARAELSTDSRGLQQSLQQLAMATPIVELPQLRIVASDPRSGRGVPERLAVTMTASAWWMSQPDSIGRPQ